MLILPSQRGAIHWQVGECLEATTDVISTENVSGRAQISLGACSRSVLAIGASDEAVGQLRLAAAIGASVKAVSQLRLVATIGTSVKA
jgi:hypothetical protein